MDITDLKNGVKVINDSYNASFESMQASLKSLSEYKNNRKIAVLGDMFELGSYAPALHREVGDYVGKQHIDCLIAVGELASNIAEGARNAGVQQIYHCKDKEEAKKVLPQVVRADSTLLVKASRGMKMEELVAELMELTKAES